MTFNVTVDTAALDRLARRLGNIEEMVEKEMINTMWASTNAIEQSVLRTYDEKKINYNGPLRASIHQEVYGSPVDGLTGEVATGALDYAWSMEEGRPPGIPVSEQGQEALDLWSKRKGPGVPGYVLARSITRKGIKGRHFMRDGFAKVKARVEKLWDGLPDRVAVRFEKGQQ